MAPRLGASAAAPPTHRPGPDLEPSRAGRALLSADSGEGKPGSVGVSSASTPLPGGLALGWEAEREARQNPSPAAPPREGRAPVCTGRFPRLPAHSPWPARFRPRTSPLLSDRPGPPSVRARLKEAPRLGAASSALGARGSAAGLAASGPEPPPLSLVPRECCVPSRRPGKLTFSNETPEEGSSGGGQGDPNAVCAGNLSLFTSFSLLVAQEAFRFWA